MKRRLSQRSQKIRLGVAMILSGWVVVTASAAPPPASPPPGRTLELPPAWLQFTVDWKPTWEETLAANPENKWHEDLKKDPATAPQVDFVARLRRIEMLKQMMARWPAERAKHLDAYAEIASQYDRMGWPWWRSWWGYKMTKDFADDPAAVQQGYQLVLNWAFGQYTHWGAYGYTIMPECRDWEFAIFEILDKFRSGKLAEGPAVRQAYSYLGWLIVDFNEYGRIHPYFEELRKLTKSDPAYGLELDNVLKQFGHNEEAAGRGPVANKTPSLREAEFELETRWEAAQHSDLFRDVETPLDGRQVQRILDLIAETETASPDGGSRIPYWILLDKRLTSLPRARLAGLVAAQNESAALAARTARMTGNGDELLRAFRRFPFAACLHEQLTELAERDIRNGLTQWAVPVLWCVVTHTADTTLRGQAYALLWVALAQDPSNRAELEKATQSVPDDTIISWRGADTPARDIKKQLLNQAPTHQQEPEVKLASFTVRRLDLPQDWPSRQNNLDGPAADFGVHAPWPVSWLDHSGTALIVGAPTAIARFEDGQSSPAWMLHPEERIPHDAWPWYIENGRSAASIWQAGRRPVRATANDGPPNSRIFCLMNTVEPPVVAAVGLLDGKLAWTSENQSGWDGMEPLSQPTLSEGRLYVLAAPPDKRTPNFRGLPRTEPATMCLVCLDAENGRMLWKRGIGTLQGARFDLARGSGHVLVKEGRVYCATNAGMLARCGAHDGMTQWVQPYPSAIHRNGGPDSINPRREGTGPLIVTPTGAGQDGPMILIAPRDHSGIIAFAHDSGKLLWETPLVPSDRLLGATGRVVVGINDRWLTALDLANGKQLYCREFPAGTNCTGIMAGPDVILITGGVLHRIRAASGETVETRDLKPESLSEFCILPDLTVVQFVPPTLVASGPSTTGRKITLPLEKVWSLPCECPELLLKEDRAKGLDRFGLLSGRRLACVTRDPNWRVTWDGLLPQPPQAAGFTGNNLVTAERWNVTARNADNGAVRWSKEQRWATALVAGDEKLTYLMAGPLSVSPAYTVLDSSSGEQSWSQVLWREKFNGTKASLLRCEPDGTRLLRLLTTYQDPATGVRRFSDVKLDAVSGKINGVQPVMAEAESTWSTIDYDEKGYGWVLLRGASYWGFGEQMAFAADFSGKRLTDNWTRRFDLLPVSAYATGRTGVHARGSGVYARLNGYLLFHDPATAREITYDVTPPGGDVIPPYIFDFREDGDRLIVVSGVLGLKKDWQKKRTPDPTPPDQWKMFVDIFERASGKNIGHQELPGVRCCVTYVAYTTMAGYETQVRIDDSAIIVTDYNGVHIFAATGK